MTEDLFPQQTPYQPLASRVRPENLDTFVGQEHLLAPGKPLREAIEGGQLHSMLLWGPPGVGKTTLAKMLAQHARAEFVALSAVLSGVKDIREAVAQAQQHQVQGRATILFVDEVHRFNKAQQDAFLPFVEDGTLVFIGATTENPSFELNNALLSRSRVYKLRPLAVGDIEKILFNAQACNKLPSVIEPRQLQLLAAGADGDARRALNLLELTLDLIQEDSEHPCPDSLIEEVLQASLRRFDKGGDLFYDQISALHKAVRGSSPDASLYWFCRMLDGGCDPLYIARRIVRMASEDIGNADPRALQIALHAWQVQERLGSPEGELALAQAVVYLASAAKSNAVYKAYNSAMEDVRSGDSEEVPLHLRNAPTALMESMDHGADYRYAHDEEDGYAAGESYFPESHRDQRYYFPENRGMEIKIREKLAHLRGRDKKSTIQRYR